ncbi:hypothetical protein KA005_69685 [bacterium]|nr:hypothetical protein [bacterium]
MELVPKNLWLNLTVVLPGMVTYGTWRLVILITGYEGIDFTPIDNSIVLSLCVLLSIALIQQAIGIFVEASIAGVVHLNKKRWAAAHALFVERFSSLAKDRFNEDVLRTIGQFFLSLNLAIGQILVLIFTIAIKNAEGKSTVDIPSWLPSILAIVIAIALIVACFRCWNAIAAIRAPSSGSKESV